MSEKADHIVLSVTGYTSVFHIGKIGYKRDNTDTIDI